MLLTIIVRIQTKLSSDSFQNITKLTLAHSALMSHSKFIYIVPNILFKNKSFELVFRYIHSFYNDEMLFSLFSFSFVFI